MSTAADRLRLGALRAATLTDDGDVVPLPWLVAGTLTWPAADAHRVLHALARRPRGTPASRSPPPPAAAPAARRGHRRDRGRAPGRRGRGAPRARPAARAAARDRQRHARRPGAAPPRAHRGAGRLQPFSSHLRLAALPAAAVDAFLAAAGPTARTELLSAELHHLAGTFALAAVAAARTRKRRCGSASRSSSSTRRLAPWAQ